MKKDTKLLQTLEILENIAENGVSLAIENVKLYYIESTRFHPSNEAREQREQREQRNKQLINTEIKEFDKEYISLIKDNILVVITVGTFKLRFRFENLTQVMEKVRRKMHYVHRKPNYNNRTSNGGERADRAYKRGL